MPLCIVPLCKNRTGSKYKSKQQQDMEKHMTITFHRLPVNAAKRKLWLENLNIQEPREKKPVVCSMHFDESLFDRTSVSTVRLRDHAVPQIKSRTIDTRKDSLTGETSIIKRKKLNPTDDTVENKSCMAEDAECNLHELKQSEPEEYKEPMHLNCTPNDILTEKLTQKDEKILYLRRTIQNMEKVYKKRMKVLSDRVRRLEKRNAALQDVVKSLLKR